MTGPADSAGRVWRDLFDAPDRWRTSPVTQEELDDCYGRAPHPAARNLGLNAGACGLERVNPHGRIPGIERRIASIFLANAEPRP